MYRGIPAGDRRLTCDVYTELTNQGQTRATASCALKTFSSVHQEWNLIVVKTDGSHTTREEALANLESLLHDALTLVRMQRA